MSRLIAISGCTNAARKADVIYVHGLGGDPHKTWGDGKDGSTSWPHWLGEEFPEIGIWSLGYAASPTRFLRLLRLFKLGSRDSGYSMPLPDRALQVLDLLSQRGLGQRSLMFICHSLGGLLVKLLLRKASDSTESRMQEVAHHTRAVLFLATPHAGAELASLANVFRRVFGGTVSIEDLREHDAHLRDLYGWYRNHAPMLGIKTATYFELRGVKGGLTIVNPTSANPGVGADPVGLDEDHISIAKPRDRNAQVCGAARDLLKSHVVDAKHAVTTILPNAAPIPLEQTDKLIDTIQKQASVIERLISKNDIPTKLEFAHQGVQGADTKFVHIEGQVSEDGFQALQMLPQEESAISSDAFARSQQGVTFSNITEVLQKIETVGDLVSEIRAQLSVWNYDRAFNLSKRLEEQLGTLENDDFPRLLEYLFLLARVHVVCAETKDAESATHIEQAKRFLAKIETKLEASPNTEITANVIALKGSIENLERGPDAALIFLENRDDPYAIRIRLAMYLKKHDLEGAAALIDGMQPHLRWCDLAVTAYAATGRRDDALIIVKWANEQENQSKYPQCVVRLADASLVHTLAIQESGKNIIPQDLSDIEREAVRSILKDLEPVLIPIINSGSVDSRLSKTAVKIAWQAHHVLGQRDEVATLARLMSTHTPVPTDVARSVMSGYMTPPPDLPKRLRKDHPNDLNANILAAVVESHMGQHTAAYEQAKKLIPFADTNNKKEELFKLFQELWQELEGNAQTECESIANPLIDHNPQLQAVFNATKSLRAGNAKAALDYLDKYNAEDDVYWLQLRGNTLLQMGRLPDAVDFFLLAAQRTGIPTLFHKTADLAFQAEKVTVAVECYEKLLALQPDNLAALSNLASLYIFHMQDVSKAAIQFRALHEAEPDNLNHTINLAICLAQLYRPEESLALYDEACKQEIPDLRAVLGRAELHLSMGDPDAAYKSLQYFTDTFWDSPDFLLACMNSAYAADNDDFAHEAFTKLNELRNNGLVDENAFKMVHTDEALEIFKKSMKAEEDRKNFIHKEMLKGRMPWIWVAQISRNAVYWEWRLRTQELEWIGDNPVNRASFSIYSTNGFHARVRKDDLRALTQLECPPPGTPVVADLSALLTLHRLELLDTVADYFGEIIVPQAYLTTVLEDGRKMVLHQRSRKRTAETINHYVDKGTITPTDKQLIEGGTLPIADEYGSSDIHRYHLIDIIRPVYEAGLIDDSTYQRIIKICTKPSGVDEEHPDLVRLQGIFIELTTLEIVASFGLLDAISTYYHLHIDSEAQFELRQRLNFLRFQEETRHWHFDLWNKIREDERFRFIQHVIPKEMRDNHKGDEYYLSFLATFVANDNKIALLTDDRVCQVMTLNERQGASHAAFGSDAVVLALSTSEIISTINAAEAMLKLFRWRYRFVFPSVEILKTYALQYRGNPPGYPLQELAEYVHDCMRDTGLFGGQENTDLKESMALRLYLTWLNLIANWLLEVWVDDNFSERTATRLTNWCIQEFLPSLPRVIPGSIKARTGSVTARYLISQMLLAANSIDGEKSITDAMKAIQAAMKLSNDEYLRIVMDILNDSR